METRQFIRVAEGLIRSSRRIPQRICRPYSNTRNLHDHSTNSTASNSQSPSSVSEQDHPFYPADASVNNTSAQSSVSPRRNSNVPPLTNPLQHESSPFHYPNRPNQQGRMPFRLRPLPSVPPHNINTDPAALDAMYARLLGRGGDLLLPQDVKVLAITHKSFDHGWQGSNDRLAFLGKRIVDLEASLALLRMPRPRVHEEEGMDIEEDDDGRRAERDGSESIGNLSQETKAVILDRKRVARLAREAGLAEVMRWKPRRADRLESSGIDTVLAHTLYSIIGALSLHRGGKMTLQIVKERILAPLGLKV